MKQYYRSKEIYTENGIVDGYLVVDNGIITNIKDKSFVVNEYVDYQNYKILPGIFDTHNHGTYGWSLLSDYASQDHNIEIKGYLRALLSQGVTSVLPTAHTSFFSELAKIKEENDPDEANIIGIHSEGPWLNRVGEKGKKSENPYPPVQLETAQKMIKNANGQLVMVGLAPEIEGIDEIMDYFLANNVKLAVAHTDGNYEITKKAIDRGITVATHMCNVMTGIHHRDFGCLGACLTDNRVWAELICDGLHVCNEMLDFVYKSKGRDNIMMISDCTGLSGLKPGLYNSAALGGVINVTEDGYVLDENGRLRGSSMPVIYGMANLVKNLAIPLTDVVKMASHNPALCHGCLNHKGSLTRGKDADFIIVDNDITLHKTYLNGRLVYDKQLEHDYFSPYAKKLLFSDMSEK